ncbi:MAG: CBS domain-containing protein [Planctomycetes bacterium]|nr:CBS domain-containing protein [Planctomycetota bacterium]
MLVRDLYTPDVRSCDVDTDLARVGATMWETNCGAVPVLDASARVVGIITDRDVCIALTTRNARAAEVPARDVMSRSVYVCHPDDDVVDALETMTKRKVRRLPVTDKNERLLGILSVDDILKDLPLDKSRKDLPTKDVLEALQTLAIEYIRKKDKATVQVARAAG